MSDDRGEVVAQLHALLFKPCPDCGGSMARQFSMQADLSMKEGPPWCVRCTTEKRKRETT